MGPLLALMAAALVVGALASPAKIPSVGRGEKRGGLTFTAVEVPHSSAEGAFRDPDPLGALRMVAHAYVKYGKDIPSEIQDAINAHTNASDINAHTNASDTGNTKRNYFSVSANPAADEKYFWTPVTIGTPPQPVQLMFDTGSADTWVYSSLSPLGDLSTRFRLYDPNKSSTSALMADLTWNIQYQDGDKASGIVYSDTFTIGDFTVKDQAIEIPTKLSGSFTQNGAMDGLLGLGFRESMATSHTVNTFMDNAADTLDVDVFTVDYKFDGIGTYGFGFIDPKLYDDPIIWTPVLILSVPGFWNIHITGYSIYGEDLRPPPFNTLVDTGTPLTYLPTQIVKEFYAQFPEASFNPSQGGWVVSCNSKLPDFAFGIQDHMFTVPGEYLFAARISNENCLGVIQDQAQLGLTIFGSSFIKAFFVVFNHGGREIGFASKKLAED